MTHVDVWVVAGLLLAMGGAELLSGRLLNRRQADEVWVDVISLGQFALLIKPMVLAAGGFAAVWLWPHARWSAQDWPLWQQMLLVILPADFLHYWYHRAGHTWPVFWRMHRTHHTATAMSVTVGYRENWRWYVFMPDVWYAGALIGLGLGQAVLWSHVVFGAANMVIHSGFALDAWLYRYAALRPLRWVLERLVNLPSAHRGHHAELDDHGRPPYRNFAQLLMVWDWLFGTAEFLRDRYPTRYGIANDPGDPWYAQLWWPLLRSPKAGSDYQ